MNNDPKPLPGYERHLGGPHTTDCQCDKCREREETAREAINDVMEKHRERQAEVEFLNPEHAELIEMLKNQLLIVFLRRLGGSVNIPVSEVDDTEHLNFAFSVDRANAVFHFELQEKNDG